jgi:hypothetical protein
MEHEPKFIQIYRAMDMLLNCEIKSYHERKIKRELRVLIRHELNRYDNRLNDEKTQH